MDRVMLTKREEKYNGAVKQKDRKTSRGGAMLVKTAVKKHFYAHNVSSILPARLDCRRHPLNTAVSVGVLLALADTAVL